MGVLQSPRTMRVIIYEALGNICRCRSIHTLCKIDFVRNFGALKMKHALFVSLESFKAFVYIDNHLRTDIWNVRTGMDGQVWMFRYEASYPC